MATEIMARRAAPPPRPSHHRRVPADDAVGALRRLVRGIRTTMLTNADPAGRLHSRPLMARVIDDKGFLYFLVDREADWVRSRPDEVNLAFVGDDRWISVTGTATVDDDVELITALWDEDASAWFPEGPGDSSAIALRVELRSAGYWSSPGAVLQFIEIARAAVTGRGPTLGEHGEIDLTDPS